MLRLFVRLRRTVLLALVLIVALSSLFAISSPPTTAQGLPWQDKGSPFGVVASLGNRVRAEDMGQAVALMREAGVQWQREEIFWDRVQQYSGGPFTWNGDGSGFYDYDRAIGSQVAAGINVLGLLDYNPAWFKSRNPHPDEWIEDWGHYVYATVARYGRDRGWIKHWELWNEPNLASSGYESGLYEVRDFVRLLEVGRAAAKAADPEAQIVMGGLASIWGVPPSEHNYDYFTYLELAAEEGAWDHVDIIAIHPYRPDAPEGSLVGRAQGAQDFRTEMRHLDDILLRYGPKPVWITEMGWSSHAQWPGVSLDTQAHFLTRFFILAITHPSIEKVFWYDFRNDTDPNAPYEYPVYNDFEPEFHYGLLRRSYPLNPERADLRKPAFLAYRTMTNMLAGAWLHNVMAEGYRPEWPGVYWYQFRSNERRVDVLWRVNGAEPTLTVHCGCEKALVRSWNGEVKNLLYTGNGTVTLRLPDHGAPMYVEYDPPVRPGGEFFPITGQTIRGVFRDYWYANGGVERFGYPLTEELVMPEAGHGRPHVVQYFERARFEHFPRYSGTSHEVGITRLGDALLRRQGIQWETLPRVSGAPPECIYFAEVGHSICPPFRAVWERYGGLHGLGYPLTEAYETLNPETGESIVVQHFERSRLEVAPEHMHRSDHVHFGMVGREFIANWGSMP
jgi:hypothetical protein